MVEGDEIPYLPAAAAKKKENQANWVDARPGGQVLSPGRATRHVSALSLSNRPVAAEHPDFLRVRGRGSRHQHGGSDEGPRRKLDGMVQRSLGRRDAGGRRDQPMDKTWFDRAGNFHSDALHVVERYTPRSADTLNYEATIEDPKVFSRPWKISMPLYRRVEKNAKLLEFKCVEFAEELLYGPLRKKPSN